LRLEGMREIVDRDFATQTIVGRECGECRVSVGKQRMLAVDCRAGCEYCRGLGVAESEAEKAKTENILHAVGG